MKKYLFLPFLLFIAGHLHAFNQTDWNYIPNSSYTEVATPGAIMFASGTVQIVSVVISSPAPNSMLTFFRSTSAVFTPDIATQTLITSDYQGFNTGPTIVDLYEMQNDSYTYFSKTGLAKVTIWLRCLDRNGRSVFPCPILKTTGQR